MGITIKVSTSEKVGSCNACHKNITERGQHTSYGVCEVDLDNPNIRSSQSFRLCRECRNELIQKLKATTMLTNNK